MVSQAIKKKSHLLIVLVIVLGAIFVGVGIPHSPRVLAVATPTQVLFGGYHTNMSTGTTQYTSLQGGLEWSVDASLRGQQSVSTSGTINNLRITLSAAPGVGKSYTFTVMKNGSAQTLSVTISDNATSGTDSAHPLTVAAGDYVSMRKTPSGTPTAASARWTSTFTADAVNESLVLCCTWFYNGIATQYCPVSYAGYYSGSTTEAPVWQVAPCAGTLDNLYITLDGAPGADTSWRCDLRVNGVGNVLTVTIADAATTGNDVAHDVAINAGDTLDFIIMIASGAPATRGAAIGMRFTSSVNGESMVLGTNRNANVAGGVRYAYAQANKDNLAWQSSEVTFQLATACTIRSLYVALSGSPGYYNYDTLTFDVNSVASALTVTIIGPATAGHDTTHSVSLANDDLIDVSNVASSGTAQTVHWGMVCYVNPYSLPTVTSSAATDVEETTATLNGEITGLGDDASCDYRGFVWDTGSHADPGNVVPASSGYANNWTESGSFGLATFSNGVTSLTPGQIYYYRSCAHNTAGWDYSNDEQSFTTKPNEPSAFSTSNPTGTTLDLTWTKGTGATNTYIRGKDGSYPADRTDGYEVYDDTGTSCQDDGLTSEHTYYYRAWSWNATSGYSDLYDEATGTTNSLPTVTSATPDEGDRGDVDLEVVIAGDLFTGATIVSFEAGIAADFVVDSDEQITATIDIAWDAVLGLRDISVTTPDGTGTGADAFTVNAPVPVVDFCAPDHGSVDDEYDFSLGGTGFIGATVVDFGEGITVDTFSVDAYDTITGHITIAPTATTGNRDVTVTTPGGGGVGLAIFEVTAGGGTLPTMLMAMVGLAGTLTFVSWRARFIVVSMAAALAWFAMGAMTLISPTILDLGAWGTTWTIMLATAFILMTFVPLLLQMRVDIRSEAKGRDGATSWSTTAFRPNEKITKNQAARERQGNFRNNLRTRWRR